MKLYDYQIELLDKMATADWFKFHVISLTPRYANYVNLAPTKLIEESSDKASVNKRKVKERLELNPRTRKQARWS